jgi:hypothetical protein
MTAAIDRTLVALIEVPGSEDRGVNVFVRAADDAGAWREVTEELLGNFEELWGDRVRFRDQDGYFVPRPDDPFWEE